MAELPSFQMLRDIRVLHNWNIMLLLIALDQKVVLNLYSLMPDKLGTLHKCS